MLTVCCIKIVLSDFSFAFQLGPNGYSFAINANGYVMFHPKLRVHVSFMYLLFVKWEIEQHQHSIILEEKKMYEWECLASFFVKLIWKKIYLLFV